MSKNKSSSTVITNPAEGVLMIRRKASQASQASQPSASVSNDKTTMPILLKNHAWVAPWVIRVSGGLIGPTLNLLKDIEDIFGSNPALAFLRITEGMNNDNKDDELLHTYQRTLHVFIEAKESLDARDLALNYVVRQAVSASQGVCRFCGYKLEKKDLRDEKQHQLYPFLPRLTEVKMSEYRSSSITLCMSCAAAEWQKGQAARDLETDVFGNIFDLEDVDFEEEEEENDDDDDDTLKETTDDVAEITDDAINKVVMFSNEAVDALLAANTEGPRDQVYRIKSLVKKLKATSNTKELAVIPENWRDYCLDLAKKFPNFEDVIRFIRDQMSLSTMGDGVLRLPPLLLLGPPGIGKTEFALTISEDLKTQLEVINLSSAQSGSTLTGSEAFWGNTQPGMLFNTLTLGEKANPIILLDEIDKAKGHNGYDPLAALYNLLELRQARKFQDLSFPELTLDASHVIWMATANSMESVNSPIIDRFSVFTIENPTPAQTRDIAANQYQRFINNHPSGGAFEPVIRDDVLNELGNYHPRRVGKILKQAFGDAAFNARNYLTVDDIKRCDTGEKKSVGMGFLTNI